MMAPRFLKAGLLLLPQLRLAWGMAIAPRQQVICTYETAAGSGDTCQSFSADWGMDVPIFESLNPGITCPDLVAGQNYCVVGTVIGDSCEKIEAQFDISATQFLKWNPSVDSDVPGTTAPVTTTVPATTTTTTPADGITTPTPIQPGMADSCSKFDLVQSGDSCEAIAAKYDIQLFIFYTWNLAVGWSCADLDVGYYVCIETLGYTAPTTTTAAAGNVITTPTPFEPEMVAGCTTFYFVRPGDTCPAIASNHGITVGDIEQWNPKVGSACTNLWLDEYICVGV
ncbi:carbohydrate-binding module family 50 protein [Aspergillus aculeatus ATCC 16872]|uniref:Carbohydrate-binding module family 50 protein n=1 Tax=Aspergillus aculeatus (strain ATCC 16872 / CBS 172.66 / WB 5094) TaxID=690307 RepID=A0A1L9WS88_ASPA1|nr:carbohydrate-binding module family 50 protein [Aspergillus aculeatus ATCC 16872]OJJ99002.1 carbohydrate-binding module family 50 protein [Aspergillus aculeatus ATCC 16872]